MFVPKDIKIDLQGFVIEFDGFLGIAESMPRCPEVVFIDGNMGMVFSINSDINL